MTRIAQRTAGDGWQQALGDRAQRLLKLLIEQYIRDGQPVGSRTLSRDSGLDLSPATIRNVMADLEEMGLVTSPHTSAGRVPTVQGYRLFVDDLLAVKPLHSKQVQELADGLETEVRAAPGPQEVVEAASRMLSEFTHFVGVVTVPRKVHEHLRHVEFLPLSGRRVLVVLVFNQHEVQNRIIATDRSYTEAELTRAANYLNRHYAGRELDEIRREVLSELRSTGDRLNAMTAGVVEMAEKGLRVEEAGGDYVVRGHTNLMDQREPEDIERLRHLFDAFAEKRMLLHLLDRSQDAEGVQLFIGEESGYEVLGNYSVVTSRYEVDSKVVGVLGVIGPTRMAYERVIPVVDITARLLGAALNQRQ